MDIKLQTDILELLHKNGIIDDNVIETSKNPENTSDGDYLSNLVKGGVVSEKDMLGAMSVCMGMPSVELSKIELDETLVKSIPEKIAKKYNVIPVSRLEKFITLAVSDPSDIFAIDDVKMVTNCEVVLVLANEREIKASLESVYQEEKVDAASIFDDIQDDSDVEMLNRASEMDDFDLSGANQSTPIVKVVSVIIMEAIKRRASDIHIEPQERSLRIRYRIDGELQEAFDLPKKNQNAILARIKIMSSLDITENRVSQDGRFRIRIAGKEIDFRVSSLPTVFGNKIVLRVLDKSSMAIGLDTLGFNEQSLSDFQKAIENPFGIILITGPTGSGKSTTLYCILNQLNVPQRHIITVEDPVEYQVPGITQIAVQEDIGLTFASGLRSILRQTPDIILIGEIRDYDTADIAIKASLTGHLVFSTLHTNNSVGSITRLVNMGVEPFLISSSLVMCCAQRLLRRICPHCKSETEIPLDLRKELEEKYPEVQQASSFYVGKGCGKCENTGYLGRTAALETFMVDDEISIMINKRASEEKILAYLKEKGFRSLRENAITKFCGGVTSLEEVFRVT